VRKSEEEECKRGGGEGKRRKTGHKSREEMVKQGAQPVKAKAKSLSPKPKPKSKKRKKDSGPIVFDERRDQNGFYIVPRKRAKMGEQFQQSGCGGVKMFSCAGAVADWDLPLEKLCEKMQAVMQEHKWTASDAHFKINKFKFQWKAVQNKERMELLNHCQAWLEQVYPDEFNDHEDWDRKPDFISY